jgi:hypothetical protein
MGKKADQKFRKLSVDKRWTGETDHMVCGGKLDTW